MTTTKRSAALFLALVLCILFVTGCQSSGNGDAPNAGMPAAQKDSIQRHKKED
jgi:hypothetical protein